MHTARFFCIDVNVVSPWKSIKNSNKF